MDIGCPCGIPTKRVDKLGIRHGEKPPVEAGTLVQGSIVYNL